MIRVNVSGRNSLWSPLAIWTAVVPRRRAFILFNLFDVCVVLSNTQLLKCYILDFGLVGKMYDVHLHVKINEGFMSSVRLQLLLQINGSPRAS